MDHRRFLARPDAHHPFAGGDVLANSSATLYAGITGTAPLMFQWYEGASGDTSYAAPNGSATMRPHSSGIRMAGKSFGTAK